jgi:hypothetical protein
MPRPTETALKGRARALLEAMTERGRWIYALPRVEGPAAVNAVALGAGLRASAGEAGAERFENEGGSAALLVIDSPDLDVAVVEATGPDAPPILAEILERTGFYAQSTLLGVALDLQDPESPKALRTLAHMVVAWDEDWSALFLLHLAAPDPVVRHEAVVALEVAVMVAHAPGPALTMGGCAPQTPSARLRLRPTEPLAMLEAAMRREKLPKLQDTMREALNVVRRVSGEAVEVDATYASDASDAGASGAN